MTDTVASRALRAAIRSVEFKPSGLVVSVTADHVRVSHDKAASAYEFSPAGARLLAAALLEGAERVERHK